MQTITLTYDNPFTAIEATTELTRKDGLARVIWRKGFEGFAVSEGKVVQDAEPVFVAQRNKLGAVRVSRFR